MTGSSSAQNATERSTKTGFETSPLHPEPDAIAPDGSEVRILLGLERGGLAHFRLGPGMTSTPVAHRTVEEIWYFLSGQGEMWRRLGEREGVVEVQPGVSITIPVGTHFQFRAFGPEPLEAIGATMPPWPGDGEAFAVEGIWPSTPTESRSR